MKRILGFVTVAAVMVTLILPHAFAQPPQAGDDLADVSEEAAIDLQNTIAPDAAIVELRNGNDDLTEAEILDGSRDEK